jgi:hypothetical protein
MVKSAVTALSLITSGVPSPKLTIRLLFACAVAVPTSLGRLCSRAWSTRRLAFDFYLFRP